jgi:2-polyprenyl-3-methyl-5-hydroxy-6-metoxy-1,4-benzoquinol methylase
MNGETKIIKASNGFEWRLVDSSCPVCESRSHRVKGKRGGAYHRDSKGVESTIVQCRECSLLYVHPKLSPVGNPYDGEDEYFEKHDRNWKQKIGAEFADKIEAIIGYKGSIIEPACGTGDFVIGAQNRGWKAKGVEMTQSYADAAREGGLDVEVASVEESKYLKEKYDAVLMLAMLEHLYEPIEMLKIAYEALNPGGLVVINVPNEASSLVNRLGNIYVKSYGMDWTMSMSPTFSPFHVVGFSPKSLKYALEKTGFEIVEITTHSGANVLPSVGFRQKFESLALSVSLLIGKVSDRFALGNEIICWARKPL